MWPLPKLMWKWNHMVDGIGAVQFKQTPSYKITQLILILFSILSVAHYIGCPQTLPVDWLFTHLGKQDGLKGPFNLTDLETSFLWIIGTRPPLFLAQIFPALCLLTRVAERGTDRVLNHWCTLQMPLKAWTGLGLQGFEPLPAPAKGSSIRKPGRS